MVNCYYHRPESFCEPSTMIQLYGIRTSRAFRCLWLLEELGMAYQHIPVDFRGKATHEPAFRAINPNGRIPAMVDGELVLFESMAINLYLASRYDEGHGLWPADVADQGRTYQWSFWVMSEVEHPLLSVMMHASVLPSEQRDPQKVARNTGILQQPFAVLEQALAETDYLLGDHFSLADLNVAAVLSWARAARMQLGDYPRLQAWLKRCTSRPACRQTLRK